MKNYKKARLAKKKKVPWPEFFRDTFSSDFCGFDFYLC